MIDDFKILASKGLPPEHIASILSSKYGYDLDSAIKSGRSMQDILTELASYEPERRPSEGISGIPSALVRGLARGYIGELPAMVGKAAQATGLPVISDIGKTVREFGESAVEKISPERYRPKGIAGIVEEGASMFGPSAGLIRPSMALGGLVGLARGGASLPTALKFGSALPAAIFGMAQAREAFEEGEKAELDPVKKYTNAIVQGLIEGGGEYLGTKYLSKLLGLDSKEVSGITKKVADKFGIKSDFLKFGAEALGVEAGTEVGQQFFQELTSKLLGASDKPIGDILRDSLSVIPPTLVMTALGAARGATIGKPKKAAAPGEKKNLLEAERPPEEVKPEVTTAPQAVAIPGMEDFVSWLDNIQRADQEAVARAAAEAAKPYSPEAREQERFAAGVFTEPRAEEGFPAAALPLGPEPGPAARTSASLAPAPMTREDLLNYLNEIYTGGVEGGVPARTAPTAEETSFYDALRESIGGIPTTERTAAPQEDIDELLRAVLGGREVQAPEQEQTLPKALPAPAWYPGAIPYPQQVLEQLGEAREPEKPIAASGYGPIVDVLTNAVRSREKIGDVDLNATLDNLASQLPVIPKSELPNIKDTLMKLSGKYPILIPKISLINSAFERDTVDPIKLGNALRNIKAMESIPFNPNAKILGIDAEELSKIPHAFRFASKAERGQPITEGDWVSLFKSLRDYPEQAKNTIRRVLQNSLTIPEFKNTYGQEVTDVLRRLPSKFGVSKQKEQKLLDELAKNPPITAPREKPPQAIPVQEPAAPPVVPEKATADVAPTLAPVIPQAAQVAPEALPMSIPPAAAAPVEKTKKERKAKKGKGETVKAPAVEPTPVETPVLTPAPAVTEAIPTEAKETPVVAPVPPAKVEVTKPAREARVKPEKKAETKEKSKPSKEITTEEKKETLEAELARLKEKKATEAKIKAEKPVPKEEKKPAPKEEKKTKEKSKLDEVEKALAAITAKKEKSKAKAGVATTKKGMTAEEEQKVRKDFVSRVKSIVEASGKKAKNLDEFVKDALKNVADAHTKSPLISWPTGEISDAIIDEAKKRFKNISKSDASKIHIAVSASGLKKKSEKVAKQDKAKRIENVFKNLSSYPESMWRVPSFIKRDFSTAKEELRSFSEKLWRYHNNEAIPLEMEKIRPLLEGFIRANFGEEMIDKIGETHLNLRANQVWVKVKGITAESKPIERKAKETKQESAQKPTLKPGKYSDLVDLARNWTRAYKFAKSVDIESVPDNPIEALASYLMLKSEDLDRKTALSAAKQAFEETKTPNVVMDDLRVMRGIHAIGISPVADRPWVKNVIEKILSDVKPTDKEVIDHLNALLKREHTGPLFQFRYLPHTPKEERTLKKEFFVGGAKAAIEAATGEEAKDDDLKRKFKALFPDEDIERLSRIIEKEEKIFSEDSVARILNDLSNYLRRAKSKAERIPLAETVTMGDLANKLLYMFSFRTDAVRGESRKRTKEQIRERIANNRPSDHVNEAILILNDNHLSKMSDDEIIALLPANIIRDVKSVYKDLFKGKKVVVRSEETGEFESEELVLDSGKDIGRAFVSIVRAATKPVSGGLAGDIKSDGTPATQLIRWYVSAKRAYSDPRIKNILNYATSFVDKAYGVNINEVIGDLKDQADYAQGFFTDFPGSIMTYNFNRRGLTLLETSFTEAESEKWAKVLFVTNITEKGVFEVGPYAIAQTEKTAPILIKTSGIPLHLKPGKADLVASLDVCGHSREVSEEKSSEFYKFILGKSTHNDLGRVGTREIFEKEFKMDKQFSQFVTGEAYKKFNSLTDEKLGITKAINLKGYEEREEDIEAKREALERMLLDEDDTIPTTQDVIDKAEKQLDKAKSVVEEHIKSVEAELEKAKQEVEKYRKKAETLRTDKAKKKALEAEAKAKIIVSSLEEQLGKMRKTTERLEVRAKELRPGEKDIAIGVSSFFSDIFRRRKFNDARREFHEALLNDDKFKSLEGKTRVNFYNELRKSLDRVESAYMESVPTPTREDLARAYLFLEKVSEFDGVNDNTKEAAERFKEQVDALTKKAIGRITPEDRAAHIIKLSARHNFNSAQGQMVGEHPMSHYLPEAQRQVQAYIKSLLGPNVSVFFGDPADIASQLRDHGITREILVGELSRAHNFSPSSLDGMAYEDIVKNFILGATLNPNNVVPLIFISGNQTKIDALRSGFHEVMEALYHGKKIDVKELNVLDKEFDGDSERIADAFAEYMLDREGFEQRYTTLAERIFAKARDFLGRIKNYFMDRGWMTSEDVFKNIAEGKYVEAKPKEQVDLGPTVFFSAKDLQGISLDKSVRTMGDFIGSIVKGIQDSLKDQRMSSLEKWVAPPQWMSNPIAKEIFRIVETASEESWYAITGITGETMPKIKEMKNKDKEGYERLKKVVVLSDQVNERFDHDQLREYGLNDKEIELYDEIKQMCDATLDYYFKGLIRVTAQATASANSEFIDSIPMDLAVSAHGVVKEAETGELYERVREIYDRRQAEYRASTGKGPDDRISPRVLSDLMKQASAIYLRDKIRGIEATNDQKLAYIDFVKELFQSTGSLIRRREKYKEGFYYPRVRPNGDIAVEVFDNVETIDPASGQKVRSWIKTERYQTNPGSRTLQNAEKHRIIKRETIKRNGAVAVFDSMDEFEKNKDKLPQNISVIVTSPILKTPSTLFEGVTNKAVIEYLSRLVTKVGEKGALSKEQFREMKKVLSEALDTDLKARSFARSRWIHRKTSISNIESALDKGTANVVLGYDTEIYNVLRDYIISQVRNATRFNTISAIRQFASIFEKDILKDENLFEWYKRYVDSVMSPDTPGQRYSRALKSIIAGVFLGGRVSSGIVQLTQAFTTGAPELSIFEDADPEAFLNYRGRERKLSEIEAIAGRNISAAKRITESYRDLALKNLTDEEKDALHDGLRSKVINSQYINELLEGADKILGKNFTSLVNLSLKFFQYCEQKSREAGFLAAFRLARSKGLDYDDSIRFASEYTKTAFHIYSSTNKPLIMLGKSGVSTTLSTLGALKGYHINYLGWLYRSFRNEYGKSYADKAIMSAFYMMALGGLFAAPLIEELLSILSSITGIPIKRKIARSISKNTTVLRAVEFGLPAAFLGYDMSGSIKLEILPRELSSTGMIDWLLGVWSSTSTKASRFYDAVTAEQYALAAQSIAPVAVENIIKAMRFGTGPVKTFTGKIVRTPEGKPLQLDVAEIGMQLLGMRPVKLSEVSEFYQANKIVKDYFDKRRDRIYTKIRNAKDYDEISRIISEDVNAFNRAASKYAGAISFITPQTIMASLKAAKGKPKKLEMLLAAQ